MDALTLAQEQPQRQVVFAAVGFETTGPATAAAMVRAKALGLTNLSFLVSHKRIIPAMKALLDGGKVALHGFLCPGHVSVIIGAEAYRPIVERYGMPCVIAGFEEQQLAIALALLTEQVRDGRAELVNAYPQAVTDQGNTVAQALLREVFEPADVYWRGLGVIPDSGLVFREQYSDFDAQRRFGLTRIDSPEPKGCRCGEVITGLATPHDCRLFGRVCTPVHPVGPCMVSSEGTCQAWFKYRRTDGQEEQPSMLQPVEVRS
jgi:hydrogenase expression/formation protein HypD